MLHDVRARHVLWFVVIRWLVQQYWYAVRVSYVCMNINIEGLMGTRYTFGRDIGYTTHPGLYVQYEYLPGVGGTLVIFGY